MKVAVNKCYGGFGLSLEAAQEFCKLKGWEIPTEISFGHYHVPYDIERHDPDLIKAIESVGTKQASGRFADIRIVDVPADEPYEITEYDGMESVVAPIHYYD